MNLRNYFGKIGKNYAWEFECFYTRFKGGFTPFKFEVDYESYCSDHKPTFEIELVMFSILIFNFTIYNIWHVDNPKSPYYEENLRQEQEELYERDGPDYEKDNHD